MADTEVPGSTILVVDDHDLVREVIKSILDGAGFEIIEAASGHEAIEVYGRRNEDISCILLDLSMPKMSGAETLVELQKIRTGIPVILMSAYEDAGGQYLVENEGAVAYVQKPFQPETLIDTIRGVLAT